MLLGNYYKALGALMLCAKTPITLKAYTNTEKIFTQSENYAQTIAYQVLGFSKLDKVLTVKGDAAGVYFGTGTIAPSLEDYWLSGNLISGIAYSSVPSYTVEEDGSIVRTTLYTITNNNSSAITISEVGYVGQFNGSPACFCMVERTLLDTPVTIPAGGIGQVTYTIRMNYTTA